MKDEFTEDTSECEFNSDDARELVDFFRKMKPNANPVQCVNAFMGTIADIVLAYAEGEDHYLDQIEITANSLKNSMLLVYASTQQEKGIEHPLVGVFKFCFEHDLNFYDESKKRNLI